MAEVTPKRLTTYRTDLLQNRILADLLVQQERPGWSSAAIYSQTFLLNFSKWLPPGPRGVARIDARLRQTTASSQQQAAAAARQQL
jgi:hypothetical protein